MRTVCKPWMTLAAAALVGGPSAAVPPADAPWPIRPYYDFVYWMAMGRSELALEQFAPDAVVIAGPGCTPQAPCVGHAAIRDLYLAPLLQRKAVLPVKVRGFSGATLRTQDGPLACASFDGHAASWQSGHAFTLQGDRIVALRIEWTPGGGGTACR